MKLSHLAVALLVSLIVYLAGSLLFSSYNTDAYARLERHLERLVENVADLEVLNRELVARADLYRRNSDAVAVEARSLSYYAPGEQVIRLVDVPRAPRSQSPGTLVLRPARSTDLSQYVRIAALVAFLLSLLVQLLLEAGAPRARHEIRRASR